MKLKGFEEIPQSGEAVEKDSNNVEEEKRVEQTPAAKIDRRQKLAPKLEPVVGPGDVMADESIMDAAREELAREGNKNPTELELKERATVGVFSTMSLEDVADRAINATIADPESARKIGDRATVGIKTDLLVEEVQMKKAKKMMEEEEQSRKIEEVARVRAEMSKKTAEAIQRGKEVKAKEERGLAA